MNIPYQKPVLTKPLYKSNK